MVKEKATVTLDREKVEEARNLVNVRSMSEVIDVALDRLIRAERLRRDVVAYTRNPPNDDEQAIADLPVELDLDDDDVDYDVWYGNTS